MNCKQGDHAVVVRVNVPTDPHELSTLGMVVTVRDLMTTAHGPAWRVGMHKCRHCGLLFDALFDRQLKPLPPEDDVRRHDARDTGEIGLITQDEFERELEEIRRLLTP